MSAVPPTTPSTPPDPLRNINNADNASQDIQGASKGYASDLAAASEDSNTVVPDNVSEQYYSLLSKNSSRLAATTPNIYNKRAQIAKAFEDAGPDTDRNDYEEEDDLGTDSEVAGNEGLTEGETGFQVGSRENIKDAVTATNTAVLGDAPAQSLATVSSSLTSSFSTSPDEESSQLASSSSPGIIAQDFFSF